MVRKTNLNLARCIVAKMMPLILPIQLQLEGSEADMMSSPLRYGSPSSRGDTPRRVNDTPRSVRSLATPHRQRPDIQGNRRGLQVNINEVVFFLNLLGQMNLSIIRNKCYKKEFKK